MVRASEPESSALRRIVRRAKRGLTTLALGTTIAAAATPAFAQGPIFGSGSVYDSRIAAAQDEEEAKARAAGFPSEDLRLEEMTGESAHLQYFGFTAACNNEQYQTESQPFTNLCMIGPDDARLLDPIWTGEMMRRGTKLIISTHDVFYEIERPATPQEPYPPFKLRQDYLERWQDAIAGKESAIAGLARWVYLADEPNWTGISRSELVPAHDAVKASFPYVQTLTSLNHVGVAAWLGTGTVPTDAIAYHQYAVRDPRTDPLYQQNLALIKTHATGKPFVHVLDAFWNPYSHGAAGITADQMDDVARNYYAMASTNPTAAALVGFHWESIAPDVPEVLGARDMPSDVQWAYRTIGSGITGKCLAPQGIEPKDAMFFQDCRFVATMQYRIPWMGNRTGMATALPYSDISNNYYFFSKDNLEGSIKIFDFRPIGGQWGVYLTNNSDLPVDVRIHDTQHNGAICWDYQHDGGALAVIEGFNDTCDGN